MVKLLCWTVRIPPSIEMASHQRMVLILPFKLDKVNLFLMFCMRKVETLLNEVKRFPLKY